MTKFPLRIILSGTLVDVGHILVKTRGSFKRGIFIVFQTYTMKGKCCNREKIRL